MATRKKDAPAAVAEMPTPPVPETPAGESPLPHTVRMELQEILMLIKDEQQRSDVTAQLFYGVQRYIDKLKIALEADNAREIAQIRDALTREARRAIEEKMATIAKESGPTDPAEMQKLVSQEYLKFKLPIVEMEFPDNEEPMEREVVFTIREVSQATERRIVELLTSKIVPLLKKFQGVKFANISGSAGDNLAQAAKVAPEVLDIMAEVVAIILNPYGKRPDITEEWVQQNVSSARQVYIIECQLMANRIRDFFSAASRVFQGT